MLLKLFDNIHPYTGRLKLIVIGRQLNYKKDIMKRLLLNRLDRLDDRKYMKLLKPRLRRTLVNMRKNLSLKDLVY